MEKQLGVAPSVAARSFVAANPEMAWAQPSGRGYMMIDIAPERVGGEWIFMETVKARTSAVAGVHRMTVDKGRRRFMV
jgi:alkaline phosphatase D